jgi:pentatricopeptide repeat protein
MKTTTAFRNPATQSSALARANMQLADIVSKRQGGDAFAFAAEMKAQGLQPDALTYEYLLEVCRDAAQTKEALVIFEDLIAMGISPTRTMFHYLLQVR